MLEAHLRFMRESDLDAVLEIERDAFASPWTRANFLHEIRSNRAAVNWVVEAAGRVVGYACVWVIRPELKINNIAVHREFRRHGLGRRLMVAILDRAARGGCRTAELEVRPSNAAALALYGDLGFSVVGRRRNYYREEGEDALLLEVALPDRVAHGDPPEV